MIAALFVETGGCYTELPGVDPWDKSRDARTYEGPWSVIAHPPCARWCQLAPVVQARYGKRIGDDDGCFVSALRSVRKWGGVLEHPGSTIAWRHFGLKRPKSMGGWSRDESYPDSWVCEVFQRVYGHRARKRTWLYFVGRKRPPELDWRRGDAPVAWCSTDRPQREMTVEHMGHKERLATPIPFRNMLIQMVRDYV